MARKGLRRAIPPISALFTHEPRLLSLSALILVTNEDIMPIRGSCHCGRIAYSLDAEPTEAIECNCSICRRRGSVLAAVAPEEFHLETSRDDIAVYTFNKHVIRHQFCRICGCAPFAEGTGPDGKAMVVINLRCAEDVNLSTIRITPFDGASL